MGFVMDIKPIILYIILYNTSDNNIFAVGFRYNRSQYTLIKPDYYGIRWIANNLFRSYLTNRKQYVIIVE